MAMRPLVPPTPTPHSGRLRAAVIAIGTVIGWHAAATAGYLIWASTLPTHNADGRCEGIGWGCTPSPRDAALLLGTFVGVPLVLFSIVVAIAIGVGIVGRDRARPVRAGTVATSVAMPVTAVGALVVFVVAKVF
jgi:hypothetical protein